MISEKNISYISLISLARNKRMSPIDLYNQNGNSYNLTYDKLDIINKELLVLNKEYETILARIKELHEIDNNN